MARYMLIESGVAVNAIDVENPADFPQMTLVRSDDAQIGDAWEGGQFNAPAPAAAPAPQSVTMRQARLALLGAGLLDGVDAALAAIPDEMQRRAAQIEWEFAATVERQSPWVANLSAALGLADVQLDALFVAAAGL